MIAIVIESAKKGKREENHIKRILGLKIKENKIYLDNKNREIIFYKMGGQGELLKIENYKAIVQKTKTLFFILDADKNYYEVEKKTKKLISDLKKYGVIADYFISCNPETKKGKIESLLLSCLKSDTLKICYSNFLECIGKNGLDKYDEKGILQKLFEIDDPPYDVECEFFKPLKDKFYNLGE